MIKDREGFILANTRLQRPAHVPEITLYTADEVTSIWRLTEEALGEIGLPPPFWAFAWAGGQGLARYLLDHRQEAAGRSVLDFAAGSGLCAIAAMMSGAAHALAADVDDFSASAVTLNSQVNGVAVSFTDQDLLQSDPPAVDLILAGDIFYEAPTAQRLLPWLKRASDQGSRVLIGDPRRSYFPKEGLRELAAYSVAASRELEDQEIKRTFVFTFPETGP
jgi:predicted nicotinamide N-methyase